MRCHTLAAFVLAAMLVVALMTPILGLAIALVQGNPVFARLAIRSIVLRFLLAVLASSVVGSAASYTGFDEPTAEMLARGGPGLLDLFVAFASGVAAAYASSRPNLLAAIPGVAIAAALVPPIATPGLALSIGQPALAVGATLLFSINLFTIVFAAHVSLWAVGIRNVKKTSGMTSTIAAIVMTAVMVLAVYLSLHPPGQEIQDVLPSPGKLVAALEDQFDRVRGELGQAYRLRRIDVSHGERGYEVIVRVTGERLVPTSLSDEIRAIARDLLDEPVQVRVVTQFEASSR